MELSGMDSTLQHLADSRGRLLDAHWTCGIGNHTHLLFIWECFTSTHPRARTAPSNKARYIFCRRSSRAALPESHRMATGLAQAGAGKSRSSIQLSVYLRPTTE